MKIVILGIGNTILRDDGVGIYVSRKLKKLLHHPDIEIKETQFSGLALMDLLEGFDLAFIIDSIMIENDKVGKIYKIEEEDFEYENSPKSIHHFNIFNAVALGRKINIKMPVRMIIYAVSVSDSSTFDEHFSPKIQSAILSISDSIKEDIQSYL